LKDLAQHLSLSGHEGLRRRHGRRWRQVATTGRSKPVGRAARGSHHLKCEPLLDTAKILLRNDDKYNHV
jgi:hypothetical protein